MINEEPLVSKLELETSGDGITWTPWLAKANGIDIQRGGTRDGASASVDIGTMSATLVNAGDPLFDSSLKPNLRVRVLCQGEPIFTGRINDLSSRYVLDKQTGKLTPYVALSASDAVSSHVNTTRYGAITAGGVGYESWAARIARLSTSSVTPVNLPADDAPITRYGI